MLADERETLTELIESLEEAAVLLAEIHIRFGGVKILNMDGTAETAHLTYGIAARAYNDVAKRARESLGTAL